MSVRGLTVTMIGAAPGRLHHFGVRRDEPCVVLTGSEAHVRAVAPLLLHEVVLTDAVTPPAAIEAAGAILADFVQAGSGVVTGTFSPPPKASIEDAVDALRLILAHEEAARQERERAIAAGQESLTWETRWKPDPRIIAALVAVRDYPAEHDRDERRPIVVVTDPERPGYLKALYCLSVKAR